MEGIPQHSENVQQTWCEWIHSRLRVCVCLSNKLGERKQVEKPSRLGFQVLSSKKKRVRNACNTIWWWYPIELRINGLRVAQIPSKRPNPILYTNQKCCKGWEFHGCLGLQTSKISGTVVPSWPCCCCCCCCWWWWCCCLLFLRPKPTQHPRKNFVFSTNLNPPFFVATQQHPIPRISTLSACKFCAKPTIAPTASQTQKNTFRQRPAPIQHPR